MYMETSVALELELEESESMCVSVGTLRPYDLINTFYSYLVDYANGEDKESMEFIEQIFDAIPSLAWTDSDHPFWDTEEAGEIVAELEDALNSICPEGWYFGTAEGDGACFGFWKYSEDEAA